MAYRDTNFNRTFLEYIRDKPFYVLNIRNGKPILRSGDVSNNGIGDLYYVGGLMDGNAIFTPESRIIVYYFQKKSDNEYHREDTFYWVETIIDKFESGVWKLAEWVENNMTYSDIIKHLSSVKDFNPFDNLNESEELDWVQDLGGEMFGDEVKYTYLRTGDEIIFTTDQSFRGCGFSEEFEKGKVLKTNGTKLLVLTDTITFCGPNLRNWSDGSNTMLEGLVIKCKGNKDGVLALNRHDAEGILPQTRYHNCVEIDRYTRAKYYMVKSREELNESNQLEHPINVGTPIYCHTSISGYEEGKWYKISEIEYNAGPGGEDMFRIYNHETEMDNGTWTIQKDENNLNYENWFSIGDSSFDTNKAFENLYEDTNGDIKLEDGTTIVFPYEYKDEDVYKLLHWLTQNGWVKGYSDRDLKQVLFDLDRPWYKGKRRPFFMLRKDAVKPGSLFDDHSTPTIYWAPTGDLSRSPKTFSKVIKAEDLLSSIDTDFFITESTDDDFEWTKDVLKPFYNCDETVIVTDRGQYYSTYLNAMAELDVPYALEIVTKIRDKYDVDNVSDNTHRQWNNGMREDHSKGVNELDSKNVLDSPLNGDVCCLYGKRWRHISRLIRLSDGKNFIMNDRGFEPYNTGDKLNENEEWFEEVEDYSKYIKVGQKFSFGSRLNRFDKRRTVAQITQVKPNSVKIVPVNLLTNKVNPYVGGTSFTHKRLIELLSSGDWLPINS